MDSKNNTESGEITARPTSNGQSLVIDVVGRLGFDQHRQFRRSYEKQPKRFNRYAVNLQRCTVVDSTGLGMLLLLRDYTGLEKENLLLVHCSSEVGHILRYASFEELFTIQID